MSDEAPADFELLSDEGLTQTDLLVVSYHQTPEAWLRSWLNHVGERPAGFGFISVGDTMRSATAPQSTTSGPTQGPETITGIADPRNLTDLGIKISEYLEAWNGNGRQTRLVFDSVTSLLQYTEDVQTAFQFLHVLTGRVQTVDATAFYKITPDAHPDQTVATLMSLFDRIEDYAPDETE